MTKNLVGVVPDDNLGIAQEVIRRLREEERFAERLKLFLAGKYQLARGVEITSRPFAKLEKRLSKVFSKPIMVDPYPPQFTPELLVKVAKYNLRPVFLPGEDITQDRPLKKWIKPEAWFYRMVRKGRVENYENLSPTTLRRGWYLADFTVGANFTNGIQVMINDPWALLIGRLREEGKIGKYDETPAGSRFSISPRDEWEILLTYMASVGEVGELNFSRDQIHLERFIEFNAIGNLYDPNRGQFNMWEWFADRFRDSCRLIGGHRDSGGLASVGYYSDGDRFVFIAGRPLVSFVS